MSEFEMAFEGEGRILSKFKRLANFYKSRDFKEVVYSGANRMEFIAKNLAPAKSRILRRRIKAEVTGWGTEEVAIKLGVYGVRYARPIEFGSKPHAIYPRLKRCLFWYDYGVRRPEKFGEKIIGGGKNKGLFITTAGGKKVQVGLVFSFAAYVKEHPGHKAHPFIIPAYKTMHPRIMIATIIAINKIIGAMR